MIAFMGGGFILHLLWENLQAPLYASFTSLRDHFWICFKAAWAITLLIGVLLAVSFELWAVYVDQRWQYTQSMPLIPVLQVGLTPVLQMLIIPLVTLLLTSRFSRPT